VSQFVFDGESLITPEAIAAESPPANDYIAEALETARAELALVLSLARQGFERGKEPGEVIRRLARDLHDTRAKLPPALWKALVPVVQNHPVSEFVLQDPFTRWSFEKPRGYSGDAHLLDFIYGHPSVAEEIEASTPFGRALFAATREASSSVAVRERCGILTRQVDETAATRGGEAEILTIAAGHLREADASSALREKRIRRWVAVDQDPLSVGSMVRDFQGTCVEAIDGSVRGLMHDAYGLGSFDLIYAAGLYDYLSESVAIRLTRKCLQMLKPGGTFMFANFAQDIGVDGYMESCMNWALLLRSEADMWNIVNASSDRNAVKANVFFGDNRNIVYAVIETPA
jgi:SAM-dependent methyltransferase